MKIKSPRRVSGPFAALAAGEDEWILTSGTPGGNEIYLHGVRGAAVLADKRFDSVVLEWREEGVSVTLTAARRESSIWASNVLCHEPRLGLLAELPLAPYDAPARRFWRRVFRLMRIPGGRHLLSLVSRYAR